VAVVGTAEVLVRPTFKGFQKNTGKALSGLGSQGDKAGSTLGQRVSGGFKKAAKVGFAAAGAVAVAGLGAALTKGMGRLVAIENAQAKMRGLGHDTEAVDAIMKNALASVKGTAFGLGEAATTAAGAVAAGIKPGKDLEGVLKSVANSAAAAGVGMDEMGGIYNKVASLGKAQNDSLQQVADKGIPIYKALAEQMGVTQEEVFDLASEGKVSFEQFEDAMTSASGTVAEEMGKTFTGSLKNAWAAIGRIGANLLSGVFDKFAPAIQGVTEWLGKLEPIATKVGEVIGVWLSNAVEKAQGFINGLRGDVEIMDTSVRPKLELLGMGIKAMIDAFKDGDVTSDGFIGALEQIGVWARAVFDYVKDVAIPAVQGFIAEFRNGEGAGGRFRDILEAVRDAVVTGFTWVRDVAVPAIQTFIAEFRNGEGAGGKFRDILEGVYNIGKQAFNFIRDEGIPALQGLWKFIVEKLWPDIKTAFIDRIWPAMQEVGRVIKNFWEKDAQPALKGLWEFIKNTLAPFLVDFYENGVKPTFDGIGKVIEGAYKFSRDVLVNFKNEVQSLRDKFVAVRDGIGAAWKGLTNLIARPINAVIDKVNSFLSGMKSALNQIPGVDLTGNWTIRKIILDTASGKVGGGPNQFLADGGMVRGPWRGPRADNVLGVDARGVPIARINPREYVLPVHATDSLRRRFGPGFLEALRRGLPGFASGGPVGNRPRTGGALDASWEFVTDLWARGKAWVKDLFDRIMPDFGGSWAGSVAKGAVGSLNLQKIADWAKEKSLGALGGPNSPMTGGQRVNYGGAYGWAPKGLPWQAIWSMVKMAAPEAVMTSNYRPGAITASGVPSLHGQGRAVDIVSGNMRATFMKLLPLLKWSQLYYSPMGGAQIGYRDAAVHRMHFDHIHAALADGGLVKPLLFDNGGYLPMGTSLVHNATGRPEPLRRVDEEGPRVVQHVTVNYPVAEATSVTTKRSLEYAAALGLGG
jgi:tape measure domain-containing protein